MYYYDDRFLCFCLKKIALIILIIIISSAHKAHLEKCLISTEKQIC